MDHYEVRCTYVRGQDFVVGSKTFDELLDALVQANTWKKDPTKKDIRLIGYNGPRSESQVLTIDRFYHTS